MCVCVCVCVRARTSDGIWCHERCLSDSGEGQTPEIVCCACGGREALWDKNEVARAWKKVDQVLKNFAIKSRNLNHFGAEKFHDLDTILLRSLGVIFPPGKIARCESALSVNRRSNSMKEKKILLQMFLQCPIRFSLQFKIF